MGLKKEYKNYFKPEVSDNYFQEKKNLDLSNQNANKMPLFKTFKQFFSKLEVLNLSNNNISDLKGP